MCFYHCYYLCHLSVKTLNDIEDFHLIYLEKHYNVNYFNYIKKSQSANYDKVRLAWIEELNVVDSYWKIRKHYRCIFGDL